MALYINICMYPIQENNGKCFRSIMCNQTLNAQGTLWASSDAYNSGLLHPEGPLDCLQEILIPL